MSLTRREFVRRATGATAAAWSALGGVRRTRAAEKTAAAKDPLPPIVDTHQHLWDLSRFRLPWLKGRAELDHSFLTKDYAEATQGLNVVKAVYMEVNVEAAQTAAEAEYIVAMCQRGDTPTVAAVVGGRPAEEGFRKYITAFKGSRYVKGVRQVFPSEILLRDKAFAAGVRLLGELGMCFDLCVPPASLTAGSELIDGCPGTRFVLDHCGNADPAAFRRGTPDAAKPPHDPQQWRRDIGRIAERKNVVCKISGIVARATKGSWTAGDLAPIVNHCLDAFGPDRVMFGGDWPVCLRAATFRQWVEALKEIIRSRPAAEQRKLLAENAVRFYGL
jgi:predicted TIM-barrel fold metal-dependent hydrolase